MSVERWNVKSVYTHTPSLAKKSKGVVLNFSQYEKKRVRFTRTKICKTKRTRTFFQLDTYVSIESQEGASIALANISGCIWKINFARTSALSLALAYWTVNISRLDSDIFLRPRRSARFYTLNQVIQIPCALIMKSSCFFIFAPTRYERPGKRRRRRRKTYCTFKVDSLLFQLKGGCGL